MTQMITLYNELQQISNQKNWTDKELDWRNYVLTLNALPDCLMETIYVLIIHYYLTHCNSNNSNGLSRNSNSFQFPIEIPYMGSSMSTTRSSQSNKGIFFRGNQLPLELKQIIIVYIQIINQSIQSTNQSP